jgi:hypothetical protein
MHDLTCQTRCRAIVIPSQRQTVLPGRLDEQDTTSFQQGGIGRWHNCLGHDGGIGNDALDAGRLDNAGAFGRFDPLRQQFLYAGFAHALVPA